MSIIAVEMYEELIRADFETGLGVDKILNKIEPLVNSYSYKFKIDNLTPEDIKQEVYVIILEGLKNYDHSKNVKLSTFLHTHIFNKMVSKFNTSVKKSNNANFLNGNGDFFKVMHINDLGENPDDFLSLDVAFRNSEENEDFSFLVEDLKQTLIDEEWNVFKLIFLEGTTIRETAQRLNIEVWTVSSIIKRIKKNERIKQYYR